MNIERFSEALLAYNPSRKLLVAQLVGTDNVIVHMRGMGFPSIIVPMTIAGACEADAQLCRRSVGEVSIDRARQL